MFWRIAAPLEIVAFRANAQRTTIKVRSVSNALPMSSRKWQLPTVVRFATTAGPPIRWPPLTVKPSTSPPPIVSTRSRLSPYSGGKESSPATPSGPYTARGTPFPSWSPVGCVSSPRGPAPRAAPRSRRTRRANARLRCPTLRAVPGTSRPPPTSCRCRSKPTRHRASPARCRTPWPKTGRRRRGRVGSNVAHRALRQARTNHSPDHCRRDPRQNGLRWLHTFALGP